MYYLVHLSVLICYPDSIWENKYLLTVLMSLIKNETVVILWEQENFIETDISEIIIFF